MIVEIDYECFLDAFHEAHRDGRRIPEYDVEGALPWLAEAGGPLVEWASQRLSAPKTGIIESGLMEGAYVYSLEDKRAAVWTDSSHEPIPLPHLEGVIWDIALSYSSEDLSNWAIPFREAMEARGVRTYVLDVSKDRDDPIWRIRFRQALFRSSYAIALLGPTYLKRMGTRIELQDMTRLMLRLRRETYFYPLIALPSPDAPGVVPAHVVAARGATDLAYAWTHAPGIRVDTPPHRLAQFFGSLARNAQGTPDLGWLQALAPQVHSVRPVSLPDAWGVEVNLVHPTLTCYTIFLKGAQARFMGVNEPHADAIQTDDYLAFVQEILSRPPEPRADEPHELPSSPLHVPESHVKTSAPETPMPSPMALLCRALQLFERREFIGAQILASEAVVLGPDSQSWGLLGKVLASLGKPEQARVALVEAAARARRTGAPGQVLQDFEEHLARLPEAGSTPPSLAAASLIREIALEPDGFCPATLEQRELSNRALCVLERPGGVRDWFDAAEAHANAGKFQVAVEILLGITRWSSSLVISSNALYMAALLFAHEGRPVDAHRALKRSIRCNPDNAEARSTLAKLSQTH